MVTMQVIYRVRLPPGDKSLKNLVHDPLCEEPSLLAPVVKSVIAKTGERAATETTPATGKLDLVFLWVDNSWQNKGAIIILITVVGCDNNYSQLTEGFWGAVGPR